VSRVNADDNDDIPWGTDPASPDGTELQSESNQLPAGERLNPFLRAAPLVPAEAAAASAGAAAKTPAPPVAARMSRPALLTGFAVLTAGVVLVVVNGLSSGTTATAPAVSAAVAHSSLASTSVAPVVVAPVVSILRMTATVTITAITTATATATTTATTTTRITAAPAVTPATPPRSQPPLGKTIPVPKAGPATAPPTTGAPTRLSVSASGSAVPGGVAVTASVDTDGAPVMVQVHVSGPQGSQQQFAMAPNTAGSGTYSRTVHTGGCVVAVTVSATAGSLSASSAPFTVRVPS